jgi:hypothetical protein
MNPQQPLRRPTELDFENARIRGAIAARQQAEYDEALAWALEAFGPGWLPSHKHVLLDKAEEDRCRYTCERPHAAATVITAKNDAVDRRHFSVTEDGQVVEHVSMEAGFGAMLLEPHPTQRIEVRGQLVAPHRYSLCWSAFELYRPKTAEELAALRETRERRKQQREGARWAQDNPLLALIEAAEKDAKSADES